MADAILDRALLAFLQAVAAGDIPFQSPGNHYDPRRLSLKESLMLGLPPRPDRDDRSFRAWYVIASLREKLNDIHPAAAAVAPRTGYNRLGLKGHMETSRNWSGAVISSPYREEPFDFLIGHWRIPEFSAPEPSGAPEYACSTWIGFDGHRRLSKSLPQIGTVQHLKEYRPGHYRKSIRAWWQWWHRNDIYGPHEYDPMVFPIAVGDWIFASLFFIPKIGVLMNMANLTQRKSITPVLAHPPNSKLEPKALDAECVLERPRKMHSEQNFITPRFDPTTFRCFASLRGEKTTRTMRGGRLIRMVHSHDRRIETIATPDPLRPRDAVTIEYRLS